MTETIIGSKLAFENAPGGDLVIKRSQFIPDEFISDLRREREDSLHTPAGEMHRVFSIPVHLVHEWGWEFINNAPIAEIKKRLQKAQLDAFITSNKV
jgi:hypothetical protein